MTNPLRAYLAYVNFHWRKAARRAALYDTHMEVTSWLAQHTEPKPWLLYERPWTQAWTDSMLIEAKVFRIIAPPGLWRMLTVVYVSGRSPFQGSTTHGLAFEDSGIAIVDSLNPATMAHELLHLTGAEHAPIGSNTIMDPSAWPYKEWPNVSI